MELKIAENVKRLRVQRGLTQESLAEILGIASQTVSKWECGDGYPDITTLPLIANFFDVSVDDILGMSEIRDEARIKEAYARVLELQMQGAANEPEVRQILRELSHEFPRDYDVQLRYAERLLRYPAHNKPELVRESIAIIERVLDECRKSGLRHEANSMQITAYTLLGENETAAALAEKLPDLNQSRESVLYNLVMRHQANLSERLSATRKYAAQLATLLYAPFQVLINTTLTGGDSVTDGGLTDAELIRLLHMEVPLYMMTNMQYELDKESNDEQLNFTTAINCQRFTAFYATRDIEKALFYLEKHVEFSLLRSKYPHGGTRIAGVDADGAPILERYEMTADEFVEHQYATEIFDPIRNHPRFLAAIERLKEHER
ncbi:MAG: helix-turn-helix domain-containing protein [Oscillospiraceae bacterium]|jgi:transcriptional regulator with XRE-family HTH domain|nr:helix-turn-helix domain-containing protein [Oscillospiraceae bacterium]